jgi:hypothetical protein
MSADFDKDDLARLIALEHAFYANMLVNCSVFSHQQGQTITEVVQLFRDSVEGSLLDTRDTPREIRELSSAHLKRMFDHVALMARHAERNNEP